MSYFNVRVYGLLINADNQILVSDEQSGGRSFSKFPGGGLEYGEGLIDALKREFMEECNAEIEVLSHFYTTDFYEKSSFNDSQIISIYYLVREVNTLTMKFKTEAFDFDPETLQSFRWIDLNALAESDVTFKTDKTVVNMLLSLIAESAD
ncbi:ADP-ribose pyrophosphatase YjhB (NUDIX family) [Pedobacter cryoconitis]|uniref:ADP-ribose pyrophosphatase YjhB (NUDIX family) n=1 Tax=Pedobacter cryoconitis TaxID=188932 RepID=A0A7W8YRA8_9SPHI|nr:NUDIX domain-containing protein [Pedobacter cryoconitis]MBB5620396.1 ADP-ribose pyrophosphatase YjhB (NUDIX family) [Pedobacter cryoconitis]MBB5646535.1 ADP-ribose pyrophosphatase YjhB (NUDIX family) [Pedobacter cryoconitis]